MKYLFFDTETTGTHSSAHITQIACQLYNEKNLIQEFQTLITPDGWEVPDEEFFRRNNMSTERCQKEGIPIKDALLKFEKLMNDCDILIAHNLSFDIARIEHEWKLCGFVPYISAQKICTMKQSTQFCAIPGNYGFKWPRLEELHRKLFNSDFEGAHDAFCDVKATAKCFFELIDKQVIKI